MTLNVPRDLYTRACAKCQGFKPALGGKYINKRWRCADCSVKVTPPSKVAT